MHKRMPFTPLIRAIGLVGFGEFANRQGLNPVEMLQRASIPQDILRRQDGILSYRRFSGLLELCARCSGNPLFGLQFGLHQGVDVFGELFYLIRNARTVGDALAELRASYSLYFNDAEIGLDIEDGRARLSYSPNERDVPGVSQVEESSCGIGLQLMRTLAGSGWQPRAIRLRHPPLQDESHYLQVLGLIPTFGARCSETEFDSSDLSLPLSSANETLHRLIADHMSRIERLAADELPSYVRQLLRHLLPSGRATIEKIADCLAIHPRTLQHWLAQEGTSFQRLLDETRQEMAGQCLADPSISMAQMSGLLGYSNPSGFNRAFNRWFGMSPLEWQRKHGIKRQPRLLRIGRSGAEH
ncbi:AraC family transcriptional regulator [Metapseudomonas furukawaii]|uniref:AraC family transcriptional regulator n=1 Tax=Metapseudomonas furukawaii TaxID=1149133 RepID=UPI00227B2FD9|nr:AraC family transcriptional regulator [Pseudomonas furukawaii]WAG77412.1 AraC family transcriptional regulator [Pseudomonas furukawaii]